MGFERNLLPEPVSYFESIGLKFKGPPRAKWKTTSCAFHGGLSTMRINTATGAWVCMSCGEKGGDLLAYFIRSHGVDFVSAAKALGCWVEDGRPSAQHKPTPLPPRAALEVLAGESSLIAIAAANVARGVALSDADLQRVLAAANRIAKLAEAFT